MQGHTHGSRSAAIAAKPDDLPPALARILADRHVKLLLQVGPVETLAALQGILLEHWERATKGRSGAIAACGIKALIPWEKKKR